MGNIPVVINEPTDDVIDYSEIVKNKKSFKVKPTEKSDCIHLITFIPTGLTLDYKEVLQGVCKGRKYSFHTEIRDYFWWTLVYGKECLIVDAMCSDI